MQEEDGEACSGSHLQWPQAARDRPGVVLLFIAEPGQAGEGVDDQKPMLLCECPFSCTGDQGRPVVADREAPVEVLAPDSEQSEPSSTEGA